MSQYTQLCGNMPFGIDDFRYALNLLSSLYADLVEITKKGAAYTVSRAQLINDKVALVLDVFSKWDTIGGAATVVKKYPSQAPEFTMKYELITQMQKDLENKTPEQETTPEQFPPYVYGKPFRSPPAALKGLFSAPSPETLSKLGAPIASFISAVQAEEIRTTGSVKTGRTTTTTKDGVATKTAYVEGMYDAKKSGGVPVLALAAAGVALFLLNK